MNKTQIKTKFVINSNDSETEQKLVQFNARTSGKFRRMMANDRRHIVVDAIAISCDSIMNRLNYPKDVVEKNYRKLNNKPAPLSHPTIDGQSVSATSPLAMNAFHIGAFVKAPKLINGDASVEIWIDEEVANRCEKGKRAITSITNGDAVGVSTGLLVQVDNQQSAVNYDATVINFDVDHLAILLDETPAGAKTFIKNEENIVKKELLASLLLKAGLMNNEQHDAFISSNDAAIELELNSLFEKSADAIASVTATNAKISNDEIELFISNKEKFAEIVANEQKELDSMIEGIVKNSEFEVAELSKLSVAELGKLSKLTAAPKKVDNSLQDPAPSGAESEFKMLKGS